MRSSNEPGTIGSCTVEGCVLPVLVKKRGLCRRHYNRWQRHGDPLGGGLPHGTSPEARFEHYVDRTESCWLWTGPVLHADRPYGLLWIGDRQMLAHRWSYERYVGPIPDGKEIDHLCRVHRCVNPAHLEAVTHKVNINRGESPSANHARKTACPKGHPYSLSKNGTRFCRTCRAATTRKWWNHTHGQGIGSGGHQRARTECPQGHPYDAENTYRAPSGGRDCRICRRERRRKSAAKMRAKV